MPERGLPFPEGDPLGGYDPYSSSKAACEILCASWRRSFFSVDIRIQNRPCDGARRKRDRRRGLRGGSPDSGSGTRADCRTEGHAPLSPGRAALAACSGTSGGISAVWRRRLHGNAAGFSEAFNFGPLESDVRPVGDVADAVCESLGLPGRGKTPCNLTKPELLRLDSGLAKKALSWGSAAAVRRNAAMDLRLVSRLAARRRSPCPDLDQIRALSTSSIPRESGIGIL